MSRISKAVAEQIAEKLVEKIKKEIKAVETQIEDLVIPIYEATIPPEVAKVYKKHPKWFRETYSEYVRGEGINNNYRNVSFRKAYPSDNSKVVMDSKQATAYLKLDQRKEELQDKLKVTKSEIENTLLALGTYKNILNEMPELAVYLPVTEGKALMHMPAQIKEKIGCLLSTDSECISKI